MKKTIYFYFPEKRIKEHKWIFVTISLMFVFTAFSLFGLHDSKAIIIGSIDQECQAQGFDYGVAKWEWSGSSFQLTGEANGTSVSGDNNTAYWTADPSVAGVIRKAGITSTVFAGGANGTITADGNSISHITFCQNEEVIQTYCELTLTKTDFAVTAEAGQELDYQLVLKNTGTANCTGGGVKVRDYFDQNTTYISSDATIADLNDSYVEWNFGTLAPGDERTVNLKVLVDENLDCNYVITNQAKYYSNETSWGAYVIETTPIECPVVEPYCGDNNLDEGEQCDDDNNVNGDGCSSSCQLESDPLCPVPVDIMLVIDRSGSMGYYSYCVGNQTITSKTQCILAGYEWVVEPMTSTKEAATFFVNKFDMNKDKIGLVSYATDATLDSGLINNQSLINDKINLLNPNGFTNIGGAINLASNELINNNRTGAAPVIVLLTDGKANVTANGTYPDYDGGASYALAEAISAKNNGFTIYTIGLGPDVSHSLMGNIASTPDKYFYAPTHDDLQAIYFQISQKICEFSSIAGCKYNDINNNGSIDSEEPTIPNWSIKLTYTENNEVKTQTTQTDENGCYAFTNLSPNEYTVNEILASGWQQTYPANQSYVLNIGYGNLISDIDFANYEIPVVYPYCGDGNLNQGEQCDDGNNNNNDGCSATCQIEYGSIAGCKYKDLNDNGIIEENEPTISQWPILLTNTILGINSPIATTTTDVNGCYTFTNLEFGDEYIVAEEQLPGWQQTYPHPTSTYTILINSAQVYDENNFANYQIPIVEPYCGDGNIDEGEQCDDNNNIAGDGCSATCQIEYSNISGCKYSDLNNNGIIEENEPTVPGWNITLTTVSTSSNPINTTTDVNGCYEFSQITYGMYNVTESMLTGWTQTYPTSTSHQVMVTNPGNYTDYHFANHQEVVVEPYCGDGIVNQSSEQCDGTAGVPTNYTCNNQCQLVCVSGCGGGGGGGPVNPILTITKSASVAFTNPGGIVDYTILVKNVGNSAGLNLKITDALPAGLSYYATTTNGVWELGNIAINETKTVTYQVLFDDNLSVGNYTNTAKAEITNGNTVTDTAVVEVRVPTVYSNQYEPILTIDKKVNMKFSNPGGEVTYTVVITNTNTGNLTAENVNLIDRLPKEFYFNSNNSTVNSWQLGDLKPGESKTVTYEVTVKEDTKNGTYENIAIASATNAPEVSARAPLEIREVTTLGITLPDTNGSTNQLLSVLLGFLILAGGYITHQLRREYNLV